MKSNIVLIDNQGRGFDEALEQTAKAAEIGGGLNHKQAVQLQLLAEEMLSLARSVTGEMQASFWVEGEGSAFDLHMTTKTVMNSEKRSMLIYSSTSRKNEAAKGFLGKLRDIFEQAMASSDAKSTEEIPYELRNDVSYYASEGGEWDGYERSILKKLADNVKISIKGGTVEVTVSKDFANHDA